MNGPLLSPPPPSLLDVIPKSCNATRAGDIKADEVVHHMSFLSILIQFEKKWCGAQLWSSFLLHFLACFRIFPIFTAKDTPVSLTHANPPHAIPTQKNLHGDVATQQNLRKTKVFAIPTPNFVPILSPWKTTTVSGFPMQIASILMYLCIPTHLISFQSPHLLLQSPHFSGKSGNRKNVPISPYNPHPEFAFQLAPRKLLLGRPVLVQISDLAWVTGVAKDYWLSKERGMVSMDKLLAPIWP